MSALLELIVRYTKALDNIRALRKERTAELKVDRERLKFLKSDKDKAERVCQTNIQCRANTDDGSYVKI